MVTRLHFLGIPRAGRDDAPADLSAKAIALLAYLAVAEGPQPRDRILGLLWADSTEDAARKNLRNTLWAIRRALGEDSVRTDGDHLALGDGVWADVRAFGAPPPGDTPRALSPSKGSAPSGDTPRTLSPSKGGATAGDPAGSSAQALVDLYAGPFLDGLNIADASEFELWLTTERERLAQAFLRAAAAAIDAYSVAGDWHAVIQLARQMLRHDPLHEAAYRALMMAHARLGERGEALRQHEVLLAVLARELGVAPLPETEALAAAIVAGQFGSPNAAPEQRPTPAHPRTSTPGGGPTFVGRAAERAALDAELASAAAGHARVVLITGEVGIGKTRLWREWSADLPAACATLEAHCLEATQGLPLAPLAELFATHPRIQPLLHPGSPVPVAWLAEVARLLPDLRAAIPDLPTLAALPSEEERRRVFEAFVQMLLALSGQPLVVCVDDAHWADQTSLDWLGYLVHRLRDRALLLVLTYRPEDASPTLVRQVAAWGRASITRRLPLDRLSPEETAALIAGLRVEPAFAPVLQVKSAGNPYFVIELSRAAAGSRVAVVPPALADLIATRLDRLPEPARHVLQAAAVLEPDFTAAALQQASGQHEEGALDALDALLAAGLLIEQTDHFAFAHPLVATVVRESLTGARRAFLNRRAAEALEAAHAGKVGPVAGRLAKHYLQAGDNERAAAYSDMAAQHALTLAAPAEAVGFYRQALSLAPTAARFVGLGDALSLSGDLAAARSAFKEALAAAEAQDERHAAVAACLGLAESFLPAGHPDDVMRWAQRSLDYLDSAADPAAHARAHFLLGAAQVRAGGALLAEAERHLNEATRLAHAHSAGDTALLSRFELGNLLAQRGDLSGAIAIYEEVTAAAAAAGDPNRQVLGHNNAAYHAMLLGDLPTAHRHIEAALALADAFGLRVARQYLFSTRGEIALAEEQWDEAETWLRRSLAEAEALGNPEHSAQCHADLALAARGRGDLDTALILLEDAAGQAAPLMSRFLQAQIGLWLTEVHLDRGERAAAAETLAQVQSRLADGAYGRLTTWMARLADKLRPT